jgi:hypothetical protein
MERSPCSPETLLADIRSSDFRLVTMRWLSLAATLSWRHT